MSFQNFITFVTSRIRCLISSVYSWLGNENENNQLLNDRNYDQGQGNEREEDNTPDPPPLPPLQLLATMQLPLLHHHHQSLREVLEPLAEALAAHPVAQQPQLRLGKRWRIENHIENIQAIEKALEEFENEETPAVSDETKNVTSEELAMEASDEIKQANSIP
ncbi:hypothetical protein J437_LFUL002446 [Ladona fulva]|uniref:Uncharacterized protein n=1 Tax=Ladona fulva TaxID=123851 RepID=A0A8K0KND9_LADFU|nr:hypothetical protein J437_LFUL002446 [Ladona fulva]